MLTRHVASLIKQSFKDTPTPEQERLIEMLADFVVASDENSIFLLKGYAGTGKTSILAAFTQALEQLQIQTVLLAPTGRAAKVLSAFTGKSAYTIHKKIYRQQPAKDGTEHFVLNFNGYRHAFFIVDEASMIANETVEQSLFGSGKLLDDLMDFVCSGHHCRLILCGDEAQLPPVGLEISPALCKKELEQYGLPVKEFTLTEVIRQSVDSGILHNATMVRNMLQKNQIKIPVLHLSSYQDIKRITGKEVIDVINECYQRYGIEETMVVCRSNKSANAYNKGIRNQILYREEILSAGDYVMAVRNNYYWLNNQEEIDFIANGDIARVKRIKRFEERYGFRFADVVLQLIDHNNTETDAKILLDTITSEGASLPAEEYNRLFNAVAEDYSDIKSKKQRYEKIKNDPYFNALQIKFAYAVTCHKAQGGQWEAVLVDQGFFSNEMISTDYLRWLYTSFTRATSCLYLVNFHSSFWGDV